MISVLSAVAEIERENILVQTMEGRKQKAREGKWNGGFKYQHKLYIVLTIFNIVQHPLKFRSAFYAFTGFELLEIALGYLSEK